MKTPSSRLAQALCVLLPVLSVSAQTTITKRGWHHRAIQTVSSTTNMLGDITYKTNSYTELAHGMHVFEMDNGGTNWSSKVRLNDDAGTNDQWNPALAIKPNGTQLFVGFYDRRDSGDNSLITAYGVIGSISGTNVTFGANFKVASDSFPGDSGYMSDYDTAAADNYFYYTWGDNREKYFALNEFNIRFRKILSP